MPLHPQDHAPGGRLPPGDSPYWGFYDEVAARQLAEWMPEQPGRILDLTGLSTRFADQLARAGHEVLHVLPPGMVPSRAVPRVHRVIADPGRLDWLVDGCLDGVVAEGRALSLALALEVTAEDLARTLRPGGRLLASVDSLVLGLARLAGEGRWAELVDAQGADVMLVPASDGEIRRCYGPEDLAATLTSAGFDVEWIRPRTVLSPATVEHALTEGSSRLAVLVDTEIELAREHQGDPVGAHLVAAARRIG